VAADHTVSEILDDARAARLVEQNAVDPSLPGLDEVIGRLVDASFGVTPANGYHAEINRAVERVVADHLMRLAATAPMSQVRAIASQTLVELHGELEAQEAMGGNQGAHSALLARDIQRFLTRPAEAYALPTAPAAPPGAPIGDPALDYIGAWSGLDFGSLGLLPYCSHDELFYRQ
jgi:hypothetical protein